MGQWSEQMISVVFSTLNDSTVLYFCSSHRKSSILEQLPNAELIQLITFWHGPGTDISCNAAPGLLSIVVTGMELNAIPREVPQPGDHQGLLELHLFKRFLFLCALRCCCRRVWRGWDGGDHHGGICNGAQVSSLPRWPIK